MVGCIAKQVPYQLNELNITNYILKKYPSGKLGDSSCNSVYTLSWVKDSGLVLSTMLRAPWNIFEMSGAVQ